MPIDPDEGNASPDPDEAFALLGHETRVSILLALWDTFESASRDNDLTYSELFERVDIRDSGNFSYHLEKLTGPYLRSTGDGYELKQTGINVMRAVVKGTVIEDPAFGPTPVDITCPICTGPVEIAYSDELLTVFCTACEGRIPWNDEPGHLFGAPVPPAGIGQRPIEETFRSAVVYTLYNLAAFIDGVCSDCSSTVETAMYTCSDHDPGGANRCPTCDRFNLAEVWMTCPTCKLRVFLPVSLVTLNDPAVAVLSLEHGVEHRFATWDTVARSYRVSEELVSEDPLRLRLTIPAGDDEFWVTVDGDSTVIETSS